MEFLGVWPSDWRCMTNGAWSPAREKSTEFEDLQGEKKGRAQIGLKPERGATSLFIYSFPIFFWISSPIWENSFDHQLLIQVPKQRQARIKGWWACSPPKALVGPRRGWGNPRPATGIKNPAMAPGFAGGSTLLIHPLCQVRSGTPGKWHRPAAKMPRRWVCGVPKGALGLDRPAPHPSPERAEAPQPRPTPQPG